jgi:hypothetical protein
MITPSEKAEYIQTGGRMTLKDVETLLQEDGKVWAELYAVLDAHPEVNLHDAGSKPFNSRDTYAHVARWMEYYAAKINALVEGKPIPVAGKSTEEVNARWQAEDASLSLEAARRWAENAYEIHERTLRAVPISMWGDELEKAASIGAANHFREHLSYITLEDARPYPSSK